MHKVAVIGTGKIGTAIIRALLESYPSVRIISTGRRDETLMKAKSMGVEATKDNDYAVRESDLVILSVKPQHFSTVLSQVKSWEGKKVVSVMAGIRASTLSSLLKGAKVVRAMPNINAIVKRSVTAIAENGGRDEEIEEVFRALGTVYWVPEEMLDVWTALVGSGPAFISEIIDGLVLGAVECGMPRDLAYNAVLDMIAGTVENLRLNGDHPVTLRDLVTTPSGTTIRGLMTMEEQGVKSALIKTVESAYRRAKEIGNEIDRKIRD
ncbi:MAG: pyrroline-5-carboxylate reductase [Candidatus Aramenus sulfurataquae]|jgi:pyrroline-5-carboxylate reductase|uniref:Pyrroline-5-carboxylate reductase n=2 Tax=Candidatus Aramenus sulfurataquae TaxID=1326980 RepID=W7KJY9_9CREN|nr:MAG: pyrroline-5-carboxylate reductase [Candidatus Aramenus sulfurataquae]MCL7344244.1 pyrroline-5-carboxylate reductase [Candidatus Aramenus sulfurataquae]